MKNTLILVVGLLVIISITGLVLNIASAQTTENLDDIYYQGEYWGNHIKMLQEQNQYLREIRDELRKMNQRGR